MEFRYIFYKGYTEAVTISSDPEFDSIISCSIQVNAGTLLGYTGLYENEGALEKNIVHVEVFAGDEAKTFFENKEKEGQNKPKILQITAGAALMAKEKKYSKPETLVKVVLKADTNVVVLDKETDTEWIHVQEKEIIRSVKREWLEYHDDKTKKGDEHYTPKKENLADVSKTFDSLELNVNSKLIYVAKDGEANRKVRYTLSDDEAEKFWVKKASLGEIKTDIITVSQNIPDCYRVNPNTVVFNSGSGKTSEEILLKFDEIETTRDSEKKLWYHIKNSSIDGWICDSDTTNVKKLSAFDWPGFRIEIEEGDTAYDPVIDFKNLSPFFKSIVDAINTDSDKSTISKEELKKAFKDDTISYKLSRLICFHQSEWWSDNGMNYWDSVFKKLDKKRAENLKCRIKNVCWWEEVSQKVKDFLPTPNVYHWHPVAFVENMREMNKEPEWIVIAKGETGQKEISGTKHNDRIVQYHKTTTLPENLYNDETAWCSSFVNWCFKQAGYIGTNSAWAKDWLGWGKLFKKPVYGAVAIVDYGKDNSGKDRGGHVGFVVGKKANGSILILGGNQGKQGQGSVNEKPFGTGSIAGYVLPADYEFVNFDLEIKDSTEEEGSYENTR